MAKMKGCKVDFIKGTITITKEFAGRLGDINSEEYIYLYSIMQDFPQLRLIRRTTRKPRRRSDVSKLTYERMLRFIECQVDAESLITEYLRIRSLAKDRLHPIKYVREWFISKFPDHNKVPQFDKTGKIVGYIEPRSTIKKEAG